MNMEDAYKLRRAIDEERIVLPDGASILLPHPAFTELVDSLAFAFCDPPNVLQLDWVVVYGVRYVRDDRPLRLTANPAPL